MRSVLEGRVKMREVKVRREELLAKVRANREKHIADYQEAVAGYKLMATEKVKSALGRAEIELREAANRALRRIAAMTSAEITNGPGDRVLLLQQVAFDLQVPASHEKDYDAVISMLEMSVDETITIRADEHACYVMDDWTWKNDFENTKALYSNAAPRR